MSEGEEKIYCLSIAGFDPSGGAGILADIKTFEGNKIHGLGVCTSITFQNDEKFNGVNWLGEKEIIQQLDALFEKFHIDWAKIGLIENFKVLKGITEYLKKKNPEIKIIWDPIFKASAGYVFHTKISKEELLSLSKAFYLITPNLNEMKELLPQMSAEEGAKFLAQHTNVLLKGGHSGEDKSNDILFEKNEKTLFESERYSTEKHGTGCVLSSAILTNLAKGYDLKGACKEGKEYVTDFIKSDNSLLGFHYV